MKTNFFEQLAGLQINGNLLLNIHHDDKGEFTVSAAIKRNSLTAVNSLPPMTWNGTTAELDERFFDQLAQPVKVTVGLINNLEAYQKEIDKAKKNAKPGNDKNAKTAAADAVDDEQEETHDLFTAPADDSEAKAAKKRLFDDAMDKAKELAKEMKYTEALAQLPDLADYPDKADAINSRRREIEAGKEMYDKLTNQFKD